MNDSKILVAKILKTKGLNGEVKLKSYTENMLSIKSYPLVDDKDVSYKIVDAYFSKDLVVAKIQDIDTKEDAEGILGKNLYIYRSNLPETNDNSYYIVDLLGLDILDTNKNIIGKLVNVHNFGANDILEIQINHKTIMLPFNEELVLDVNLKEGKVILSDIYKAYL